MTYLNEDGEVLWSRETITREEAEKYWPRKHDPIAHQRNMLSDAYQKTEKEWGREYIDSVTVKEVYIVKDWEPHAIHAKVSEKLREYHEGRHDRTNHNDQDDRVDIPPEVSSI